LRALNPYNFALNRGDSTYDARQRFVVSYDYELPHLSRIWNNHLTRAALDGWHIAGITTLQTGFPVLVGDSGFRSLTCDEFAYYGCWDGPNAVGPVTTLNPRNSVETNVVTPSSPGTPQPYYWFNPSAFALEPIGALGNEGRNNFHGPGLNNTDLTLSKRVYFNSDEKRFLELRLEGFNVFNHTQFAAVSAGAGGSGVQGDINQATFGRILSASSGRIVQLGAKLYF
jgi:hypothetical protein